MPLGIHVTVVEPGFFRSDVLDNSKSLLEAPIRYTDYDGTAGVVRGMVPGLSHHQPGDPVKLARALLDPANADTPALRLPLGPDALQKMAEKNAIVERETEAWRNLAASTNHWSAGKNGSRAAAGIL